jgi:hypothetical protein
MGIKQQVKKDILKGKGKKGRSFEKQGETNKAKSSPSTINR